jgi:DNA replication licensing factor MCM4
MSTPTRRSSRQQTPKATPEKESTAKDDDDGGGNDDDSLNSPTKAQQKKFTRKEQQQKKKKKKKDDEEEEEEDADTMNEQATAVNDTQVAEEEVNDVDESMFSPEVRARNPTQLQRRGREEEEEVIEEERNVNNEEEEEEEEEEMPNESLFSPPQPRNPTDLSAREQQAQRTPRFPPNSAAAAGINNNNNMQTQQQQQQQTPLRQTPGLGFASPFMQHAPASQGRNDTGRRSIEERYSLNPKPFAGLTEEEIEEARQQAFERDPDREAEEEQRRDIEQNTFIWGTKISVDEVQRRFKRFLENLDDNFLKSFETQRRAQDADGNDDDDDDDDGMEGLNPENTQQTQTQSQEDEDLLADSIYIKAMRLCYEKENINLDIDCTHISKYDSWLYDRLIAYPQELIPLFDNVANKLYVDEVLPNERKEEFLSGMMSSLQVRPFNLLEKHAMRDLNPSDIDKMVAVKGMVTRCSAVIPDLKGAFFKCLTCGASPDIILVDRGRVNEPPLKCLQCSNQGTMTLIHNRCIFANKQQVKMQETPDAIPEGATPNTVSMCVFDSLVDEAKPGDRVEVTGVYRAVPIRVAPNQRAIRSIYKTYLDIIHIRKDSKGKLRNTAKKDDNEDQKENAEMMMDGKDNETYSMATNISPRSDTELEFSAQRIREIEELSKSTDVYEILAKSVAPSIWELEDIKKGILCQLFGATNKTFKSATANKVRGDINILLVGDPGVAKSQLLTYVHRVAPRGMYTSGSGSSAVGLTAYVSRDPETKDMVLESGALVLSDRGVCCIDEFDKMSDGARSMLHEVMEQQTVSIAKAGIIAVLNARTSVLASANPVGSRYNPNMSIVENLNLPPTLLSRFDLLYLVLDRPNPETDRRLARHLVSLHYKDPPKRAKATVSADLLTDYISYAKQKCHPVLGDEAGEQLVDGYVEMRRLGTVGGRKVVTATPRQLESLIRISEALARIRLSPSVDKQDSTEALRLMKVAMQSAAIDPKTGLIDMDKILTGHSAADRKQRSDIAEGVEDILQTINGRKLRLGELVLKLKERNAAFEISMQEVRDSALLLAEQDRAIVKGDLVQLI